MTSAKTERLLPPVDEPAAAAGEENVFLHAQAEVFFAPLGHASLDGEFHSEGGIVAEHDIAPPFAAILLPRQPDERPGLVRK